MQFLASLCCSLTNLKEFLLPTEAAGRTKEASKTHFVLVAKRRVNTENQQTDRFSFGWFPTFALTGPWKSIQRYAARAHFCSLCYTLQARSEYNTVREAVFVNTNSPRYSLKKKKKMCSLTPSVLQIFLLVHLFLLFCCRVFDVTVALQR